MNYLSIGLIIVWVTGFFFLIGCAFNFYRLALNNPASEKPYWDHGDYADAYAPRKPRFTEMIFLLVDLVWIALPWSVFREVEPRRTIGPLKLTEAGRKYQDKSIRIQWMVIGWIGIGVFLILWASA